MSPYDIARFWSFAMCASRDVKKSTPPDGKPYRVFLTVLGLQLGVIHGLLIGSSCDCQASGLHHAHASQGAGVSCFACGPVSVRLESLLAIHPSLKGVGG